MTLPRWLSVALIVLAVCGAAFAQTEQSPQVLISALNADVNRLCREVFEYRKALEVAQAGNREAERNINAVRKWLSEKPDTTLVKEFDSIVFGK